MIQELATTEAQALAEHEATIEKGLQTFVDVGNALLAIRDERLYRAEFGTFEEYCQERWGFSRIRAHQLMAASDITSTIVNAGLPAPTNEGQARELGRIPEEQRADVWRETHDRTDGKPTAAAIRETWHPPAPEPEPQPAPEPEPDVIDPGEEPAHEPTLPQGQDRADEAHAQAQQRATTPAPKPKPPEPPVSNETYYALARQQALNAYSEAVDGLIYLEAYTNSHTPPDHIPDHYPSIENVMARIEAVLTTWKEWADGR